MVHICQSEKNLPLPWAKNSGTGMAFGTFGELLQGRLEEEPHDFLVTLPITRYSYALFLADPTMQEVIVFPPLKQKSKRLADLLLAHYGQPGGGRLILQSELPVGKGLASSSADLVATARAVGSCFHLQITPAWLSTLMCQIEPSDGVMYKGAVAFYHRQGSLHTFLGALPPLTIVGIDEGGELDTIEYNQRSKLFTRVEVQEYQQLLDLLACAICQQDVQTIGRVATRSALLNQKFNPKQTLGEVLAICQEIDALGVVTAHSGTSLGILLSPYEPCYHQRKHTAQQALAKLAKRVSLYTSFQGVWKEDEKDA